jgi:predicted enzyme related to lactoylglutathione lyase
MNPVVHFEVPGEDMARMQKFYTEAFGWQMQNMGADYNDYIVAMTTESDKNGPLEKGRINGGFYKKNEMGTAPSFVIGVGDINEAMDKIKAAGGEVLDGPTDIPNVGVFASFRDTEGNRLAVMQPIMPQA